MLDRLTFTAAAAAAAAAAATALAFAPPLAHAGPPTDAAVTITLRDHRFTPDKVSVPAGVRVRVTVLNQDSATEEFDSSDLKVEALVTPHGQASFWIGPLKPGSHAFMGEFHPATAQGHVIAFESH